MALSEGIDMSTSDKVREFREERDAAVMEMANDERLKALSMDWMLQADQYKYTYNFTWMGRPIIKFPNDMVIQQELMWNLKPDLVIETGIAHGGSIIFSAAMQKMMDIDGKVVGVDIDIRDHNRVEIEKSPVFDRIELFEGSSTDPDIFAQISKIAAEHKTVMVFLDSLHTHDHVLEELRLYSTLVSKGSYCVLPDTFIQFFPKGYFSDTRPWDVGNNPYTAMEEFLSSSNEFEIDRFWSGKGMITETIDGYLKRVK